jgi:mRNA interferase HigB
VAVNIYSIVPLKQNEMLLHRVQHNFWEIIVFEFKSVQIKWFGTHAEYDKINVETIQYKKK